MSATVTTLAKGGAAVTHAVMTAHLPRRTEIKISTALKTGSMLCMAACITQAEHGICPASSGKQQAFNAGHIRWFQYRVLWESS